MRTNFERNCPYRAKNSIFQHRWVKNCLFTLCIASQKSTAYAVKCKQIFLDSSMLKKWFFCSVWYGSFKICKNLQDFQLRQIVIIFAKKNYVLSRFYWHYQSIYPRGKKESVFAQDGTIKKWWVFYFWIRKDFVKYITINFQNRFYLKKDMVEN